MIDAHRTQAFVHPGLLRVLADMHWMRVCLYVCCHVAEHLVFLPPAVAPSQSVNPAVAQLGCATRRQEVWRHSALFLLRVCVGHVLWGVSGLGQRMLARCPIRPHLVCVCVSHFTAGPWLNEDAARLLQVFRLFPPLLGWVVT